MWHTLAHCVAHSTVGRTSASVFICTSIPVSVLTSVRVYIMSARRPISLLYGIKMTTTYITRDSILSLSSVFLHSSYCRERHSVWHYMCLCMLTQSYPTLHDPMDCSLPGSSVYAISQARILEWVTISSSTGSSWPRDHTPVFCIYGDSLPLRYWEALLLIYLPTYLFVSTRI